MRKFLAATFAATCLIVLIGLLAAPPALSQTLPNANIIQEAAGNCDGCTTASAVLTKPVTAGDGLLVIGLAGAGSLSSALPLDAQSDSFAVFKYVSVGFDLKMYLDCNAAGGATTVSLTGGVTTHLQVYEIAGQPTSGCGDATGSASHIGATTTAQSVATSGTVSQANELVFAAFGTVHTVTTSIAAGAESSPLLFSSGSASTLNHVTFLTEIGNTLTGLTGIQTSTATLNNAPDGAGDVDALIGTIKLSTVITGGGGGGGGSGATACPTCVPVKVNLSWTSSGSGLSYNIYQSSSSAGPFTKIAGGVANTTYVDANSFVPGQNSFYEITAVDGGGNEGAKSASVSVAIPTVDNLSAVVPTAPSPVVSSGGLTVSAISATGLSTTSATVNWTTNVAADSQVGFAIAPSTSYKFSTCCEPSNTTSHAVVLAGLTPGTTYNFVVDSTMTAAPNTEVLSSNQQFSTPGGTSLTISNVAAGAVGQTGATVTWSTNTASTSRVGYAVFPSTSYIFTVLNSSPVTSHSVALTGLSAGTKYNFIAESVGGSPSATVDSSVSNFTTAAPTPISITAVAATNLMPSSATITWTTDQNSSSQVLYAISPSVTFQSTAVADAGGVTSHSITLSGLQANTPYNFEVKSVSTSNSSVTSTSAMQQFVTPQIVAVISNVAATNVTATGATITWTTQIASTSQVGFAASPSTSYTQSSLNSSPVTSHSVTLTGLSANTTYNFIAESNTGASPNQTFATLNNSGAFTVSNITVSGISTTGATVNWTTTSAADSQVGYTIAPSTKYLFSPCCAPNNVTSHSVTLSGLQAGTVYNFVVDSTQAAAPNTEVVSPAQQFTTSGTTGGGTGGGGGTPAHLAISGIGVSSVSQTSATFVWTTNNVSSSNVGTAVSPSTSFSFGTANASLVSSHSFIVSGLTAGTTYNYEVQSNDGTTTATSASASFTTTAATTTGGGGGGIPGTDCNVSQSGCTGPAGPVKAFPSAQGAGAASVGGRGGVVMEVTNGNDTGSGSLRSCIEANGPRNCIFRTSAQPTNTTRLQIRNPFITIAGQTAPGSPIVLHSAGASTCTDSSGCTTLFVSTHDFIIRYLTYDGFAVTTGNPVDTGTVGFEYTSGNVFNGMTDHNTSRWWGNATMDQFSNSGGPVHDLTGQYNLFYEPNFTHAIVLKFDATDGSALAAVNLDFHHNLGMNFARRWPLSAVHSIRFVSNIAYDWANNGSGDGDFLSLSWGGLQGDYISNLYKDGPDTQSHTHPITVQSNNSGPDASNNCQGGGDPCDNPGPPSLYLLNNIGHQCTSTALGCTLRTLVTPTHSVNDATQKSLTFQGWEGGETSRSGITSGTCKNPDGSGSACVPLAPLPDGWFRNSPLATETFPITQDAAENLDAVILPTVGNSQHLDCNGNYVSYRDSNDTRVINQYKNGGSGQLFAQSGSPQYSTPASVAGTPCQESNHDGVPDQWKSKYGLSLSTNAATTKAPNGYTYLENYLNGTNPNK